MPAVLEMFAQHVPLGDSWMHFTGMLAGADSRLEPVDRELLILRVAWLTRSGYEWVQHARMGVDAGLTSEQVDAVPHWRTSELWSPKERALLAAADEILDAVGRGRRDAGGNWAPLSIPPSSSRSSS